MVEELAARGEIRLGLLYLQGCAVAAQIWLVADRQATIFKLAHRADWLAYSPGTLLTHWMFSQLLTQEKIRRVDFGRGDDAYKCNWLRQRSYRWGIVACNPRNPAGLLDIAAQILPTWLSGWIGTLNPAADPPSNRACFIFTGDSRRTSPATEFITNS
jgi:CelD/BcsL family acetyltransferase involved in cellulose biosynthesis